MKSLQLIYLKLVFWSLALFPSFACMAQADSVQRSEEYYKKGMDAFNFVSRTQATELFKKAIRANPKNAKAYLMAGKSIMLSIKKNKSLYYFKEAYRLDQKIDEDIVFFIGQAYHYAEEFDSALMYYEKFNALLSRLLLFERSNKINEVNRKIFECRNAKVFKTYPVDVTIENLGSNINSEYADYAPNISADESVLVFTTRRPDGNSTQADDQEFYEEIFFSKKTDGKWQPSVNMGSPLNTVFHNANVSLSPNGKKMFVYKDENGGDLYETDLANESWTKPKRLNGYINSPYLENSAAVTLDEQKLFFVSDRPGGYGGTDIYVAYKNKNDEWSRVQNLGSVINTDHDEEDVFVSANGKHIFFSSNGHAGMGDLDIYRSTYDSTTMQWAEPLNLGYPINSVENDIYFVLSGDERYAYISSMRENSLGNQDIYRVDLKNWKPITRKELMESELTAANLLTPLFTNIKDENQKFEAGVENTGQLLLTVDVFDEATKNPLTALLKLTSEGSNEIVLEKLSPGIYQTKIPKQRYSKYILQAEASGYLPARSTMHLFGNAESNSIKESLTLTKAETKTEDAHALVINFYYKVNSEVPYNMDELKVVQILMMENPSVNVLIEGHTDSYGEAAYNQQLSQKRVDGIKKTLVDTGISPSRIKAVGYGATRPQADNVTFSGRSLNRRTVFTIIR